MMITMGGISPSIIAQNMVRGIDNFPLMAVPFFILAGEIMNVGGISRRIVNFAKALVGHVVGGLGYVAVLGSMIFAGVSGSAVADTSAIGSILLPVMDKEGYDKRKSTALICSAGTIGPIIPPSIPMILFGVIGNVSVVKLFLGGIIPGLLIGLGLMFGWYLHARKSDYKCSAIVTKAELWEATKSASWALVLPVIILGGILSGVFTPTEASVIAVVYAMLVGFFAYRELEIEHLPKVCLMTVKSTAVVMLVCGAATVAAYFITIAHIPELLASALLSVSDNVLVLMLLINLLLIVVGCVMDITPALFILTPILLPIILDFGLDPVYFGVVMVMNLCIGLITPPVGTVLYVGCSITKLSMAQLTRPIFFNVAIMVVVLLLVTYVPGLITYIPDTFGK
jgi:tripartite ATP-independent transporter DctM subunit